jgi:ABC-type nitrate/sulfonate/bicarbonate transport system substrate-binding protein
MKFSNLVRLVGTVFLVAVIGAVVVPGSGLAQQPETVRVGMSWIPNVEYGGIWIGLDKGYFKDENLNIEYFPGGPNAPDPLVTLSAGKIEIGYGAWLPFLDAVTKGNDFVLIAATFPVSPLGILSLADIPIVKAEDIVGKKILAQGAKERNAVDATLKLNNLPIDWQHVPTGFSPEPLLNKQGDGYTAFGTNQVVAFEMKGMVRDKDFYFVSFDQLGFRSLGSVIFTTRAYLDSHREIVVKFLRALTRGWTDNLKDPTVAAKLAVEKYGADLGLNLQQQIRQNEIQIKMMNDPTASAGKLLALDADAIAGPLYKSAMASGRETLPDPAKVVDVTVMQEVYKSLP